jgi:hypothetical protein
MKRGRISLVATFHFAKLCAAIQENNQMLSIMPPNGDILQFGERRCKKKNPPISKDLSGF